MISRQQLDLELVRAAQAGDVRAFEALIKRYKPKLIRYLSMLTRNSSDVEDVAQEVFMQTYQGIQNFRGDSAFTTWFFRIAINTARRNMARNRQRIFYTAEQMGDPGSEQYSSAETDFDTPEARMETRQIIELLNTALDDLPPEQSTALILREIEGYSYEEIAEQMHTPLGTVRSRIHRARDTIAAALRKG